MIEKIKKSDNIDILQAVQTILDNADKESYNLSKEQLESIELGKKDIEQGNSKLHAQFMQETQAWLKKK